MKHITSYPEEPPDISAAYQLFPHAKAGSLARPAGKVGIMIGQDNSSLLPVGGCGSDAVDDLRIMKIRFGTGLVLGGHHPQIKSQPTSYTKQANLWRNAIFLDRPTLSINHTRILKPCICAAIQIGDFFESITWESSDHPYKF